MNSLQQAPPSSLYQHIQQKRHLNQGFPPQKEDSLSVPTNTPLSPSLEELKKGFYTKPPSSPILNASIAQPIQVQIVPSKKNTKEEWKSWVYLGFLTAGLTASMWLPWVRSKMGKSNVDGVSNDFQLIKNTGVKFKDVLGVDEAKKSMMDILDFIKNPEKYRVQGANMPKGLLLKGSPGTGKTLLAKALAGEAEVPFLAVDGSSFSQKYYGVGPQKIRTLFQEARHLSKKNDSPVIIYIDEIDALIRAREHSKNEEGNTMVNQFLSCIDGMHTSEHPIIVIGSTNAELSALDPAAIRAGRLERHIQVDLPDIKGRQDLFKFYGAKYKLSDASKAYLDTLAKNSTGFSGADIKNILNEAAILSARDNHPSISPSILEEAVDRILMGSTRQLKMPKSEKEKTAYHEMGHAIVGHFLEKNQEIKKVTIVPRDKALGVTWSQPNHEYDVVSKSREDYLNEIAMAFGGRIAEEHIYGINHVTSGASSDLDHIRKIAEAMVWKLGWSGFSPRNFSNSEHLSEHIKQRL